MGEANGEDEETVSVYYAEAKQNAYSKLFNYIRNDLFENKDIRELSKLNEMLVSFMKGDGVQEIKPSTSKNLKRKLSNEFKDMLFMTQNDSNRVLV